MDNVLIHFNFPIITKIENTSLLLKKDDSKCEENVVEDFERIGKLLCLTPGIQRIVKYEKVFLYQPSLQILMHFVIIVDLLLSHGTRVS